MGAIKDILDKFGGESVRIIQENMAAKGVNATGQTSAAIRYEAKDSGVKVSGPSHVFVLETGRGPGKMPPVGKIATWIQAKKISITGTIQSNAYAISKVIAVGQFDKKGNRIHSGGTKLFRMGGRTDIITPVLAEDRIDVLSKDITDAQFDKVLKVIDGITNRK